MKLSSWLLPAALVAVLAVTPGCKKEQAKSYKNLEGDITLDIPVFVQVGYTKTFMIDTLMTVTCPDGDPVGYYFTDPDTSKRDTLVTADGEILKHHYTFTAVDKRESQTLSLTAFVKSGYYSTSGSAKFTIVSSGLDGKGSLTGFDLKAFSGRFVDARDGRSYYYTKIGDLDWMRHNLAWEGAGRAYWDCAAISDIFGRYYTWEEAKTACPEGWRLPTDAEWTALKEGAEAGKDIAGLAGELMGDLYFNGEKMWEYWREVKITDKFGFSAIPVGYATNGGNVSDFQGAFAFAAFWTADEENDKAVCRYMQMSKDIVYRGGMSKQDFAASVRCVRER